jgi:hypothetical protein
MIELGKVFRGQEFVADVQHEYRESEYFDEITTLNGGECRAHMGTSVYIVIRPPLHVSMDKLTLHRSDGKKHDFSVERPDGMCRAMGDPY